MNRPRRIAIVNRGEAAMRFVNAVHEFNVEQDAQLTTIALFTDPDERSMFVRRADEAYHLGPPTAYHDEAALARALADTSADAVWCGWGIVEETGAFGAYCDDLGVRLIGPPTEVLSRLDDAGAVARIAEIAGVRAARVPEASSGDATNAPNDSTGSARLIQVQIVGDDAGVVWSFGVRECSVRRGDRRLLSEAPAPTLSAEQDAFVRAAATRIGTVAGYVGVGSVDFLVDTASGAISFLGVHPGLQIEHPVTELTTGVDMVKLQLHVACGGHLEGEPPATIGHAVQARVSAVEVEPGPDGSIVPTPGRLSLLRLPSGPGLQVDTGVEEGDEIIDGFDPVIAKVTAFGSDRREALARLRRAMRELSAVVVDGNTDKPYQRWLLDRPELLDGTVDLGWLERLAGEGDGPVPDHADVALAAAAIEAHGEQMAAERRQFRSSALRGRPEVDTAAGRTVNLRMDGHAYRFHVYRLAPNAYRVVVDGRSIVLRRHRLGRAEYRIEIRGTSYRLLTSAHGVTHVLEIDGHVHRIIHDEGGVVRAPAPAVVVSVDVSVGSRVRAGDQLAVVEAMKLETIIEADFDGVVTEVHVPPNSQVPAGTALVSIRPDDDTTGGDTTGGDTSGADADGTSGRVDFEPIAAPGQFAHGACRHYLDAIRQGLLGFDVDPDILTTMSNPGAVPCPDVLDDDAQRAEENDVLGIFADVIALFRRDPDVAGADEQIMRRTSEESLFDYLRRPELRGRGLPSEFLDRLCSTLAHFGIRSLEPTSELDVALYRLVVSHQRMGDQLGPVLRILEARAQRANAGTAAEHSDDGDDGGLRVLLDRVIAESRHRYPAVHDLADELRYRTFDEPMLDGIRTAVLARAHEDIGALAAGPTPAEREHRIESLVDCTQPIQPLLTDRIVDAPIDLQRSLLEVMARRFYRIRRIERMWAEADTSRPVVAADYDRDGARIRLLSVHSTPDVLEVAVRDIRQHVVDADADTDVDGIVVDVYLGRRAGSADPTRDDVAELLARHLGQFQLRRVVMALSEPAPGGVMHATFRPDGGGGYEHEARVGGLHPMMAERLDLWRLDEFDVNRLDSPDDIHVYHGGARENPRDERVFVLGEVRDLTPVLDDDGRVVRLPEAERIVHQAFGAMRRFQAARPTVKRLQSNRVTLFVWPSIDLPLGDIAEVIQRLTPDADGLGIQKVEILARFGGEDDPWRMLEVDNPHRVNARLTLRDRPTETIRPLQPYEQNVVRLRQRGLVHPYELIRSLTPSPDDAGDGAPDGATTDADGIPFGQFTEYDMVDGRLVAVDRSPGENTANVVVGVVTNRTERYPDGMTRVILVGDPTRGMGNLAEPECSRINAAFDLADELGVPLEWFAVSAGARIAMDSGTENMDWIAAVLRRIIEFTQSGGEVNIVVTGINVGAQPYWNAEATMLMHTSGILIMMPDSAMVLTGKDALDFSGGVSADDNLGIGGYERIMGPNGQGQHFAHDLTEATRILFRHYEFTYRHSGERFARRAESDDPVERDIRSAPHGGPFATVGEVFDESVNPDRKRPFEMRKVMAAVVDADQPTLERWLGMADAEIPVVWDAFLGGRPITLLGFESKNLPRPGLVPADGPDRWTAGTLFPEGSRKVARAINAASGNRPLVVLANLSGFDGSPESMRKRQLEFGAEIGRAIVNFDGPIVFCVVSRYHGGAFVVFSAALNDNFEVAALEGSRASVIGGAPAAAVVFAREVRSRVEADPRIVDLERRVAESGGADRTARRSELAIERERVHAEKMGEVADEFDAIHDIGRAQRVGSVDVILPAADLRPYLVDAVERGIARVGAE